MAKRKSRQAGGLGVSPAGLLRQLQGLQQDVLKTQEEIGSLVVTATAGGGAVTAVVTGDRRVQSVKISPDVVDREDVDMLQDLVVAAVNEGLQQIERTASERMSSIAGGVDIPGLS